MTVEALVEVRIALIDFCNIDLFERGFYQVRCRVRTSSGWAGTPRKDDEHVDNLDTALVHDESTFQTTAFVIPEDGTHASDTIFINFKMEDIRIDDEAVFDVRIPVQVENAMEKLREEYAIIEFELWFESNLKRPTTVRQLVRRCSRLYHLHGFAHPCATHTARFMFDYMYSCSLSFAVHSAIVGFDWSSAESSIPRGHADRRPSDATSKRRVLAHAFVKSLHKLHIKDSRSKYVVSDDRRSSRNDNALHAAHGECALDSSAIAESPPAVNGDATPSSLSLDNRDAPLSPSDHGVLTDTHIEHAILVFGSLSKLLVCALHTLGCVFARLVRDTDVSAPTSPAKCGSSGQADVRPMRGTIGCVYGEDCIAVISTIDRLRAVFSEEAKKATDAHALGEIIARRVEHLSTELREFWHHYCNALSRAGRPVKMLSRLHKERRRALLLEGFIPRVISHNGEEPTTSADTQLHRLRAVALDDVTTNTYESLEFPVIFIDTSRRKHHESPALKSATEERETRDAPVDAAAVAAVTRESTSLSDSAPNCPGAAHQSGSMLSSLICSGCGGASEVVDSIGRRYAVADEVATEQPSAMAPCANVASVGVDAPPECSAELEEAARCRSDSAIEVSGNADAPVPREPTGVDVEVEGRRGRTGSTLSNSSDSGLGSSGGLMSIFGSSRRRTSSASSTASRKSAGHGDSAVHEGSPDHVSMPRRMSCLESAFALRALLAEGMDAAQSNGEGHMVVFVHGLAGNCHDLRVVKNRLLMELPNLQYFMSAANQYDTFADFEIMTDKLVAELLPVLEAKRPSKLSFVGHSLGNIVIRCALGRAELQPHLAHLHTFLSLAGPHLGTVSNGSTLVTTGMWVLQRWKHSMSLSQLGLSDASDPRKTFLYQLSQRPEIGLFRNVLLVASRQDKYVPFHSARLEPCRTMRKDSKMGPVYEEMRAALTATMAPCRVLRFDVVHSLDGRGVDKLIGRAAHVAMLDSDKFVQRLLAGTSGFFA